jgi:hypothetical protein
LGQKRVAIYCRVSTADQSCERQERDLLTFAERAGYEVVGVFKETGSGVKLDRAERKKVMALAQARRIDAVLVTELSRWGRSTLDLLHTLEELEAKRISVIALNGMAFDLSTSSGRMMATAQVRPTGTQGACSRCPEAQLPPERARVGAQQEHGGRHRQAPPPRDSYRGGAASGADDLSATLHVMTGMSGPPLVSGCDALDVDRFRPLARF